jgi:hypothetical protein
MLLLRRSGNGAESFILLICFSGAVGFPVNAANADQTARQSCGQRRKGIAMAHTKTFIPKIVAMNVHVVTGYGMMPWTLNILETRLIGRNT